MKTYVLVTMACALFVPAGLQTRDDKVHLPRAAEALTPEPPASVPAHLPATEGVGSQEAGEKAPKRELKVP